MVPFVPLLSEEDPAVSSEGAIDPLGLYTIADALGSRLAPGVRERQSRPRWLTAIAAGMVLCEDFPEDAVARDEISEPWQVFEWYVVEGLVRTATDGDDLTRLPGLRKARQAVADRVPLSASRYLKAPSVYGFHGVYRTLAREIGLDSAGRLGEHGLRVVETWAEEQGLRGFFGTMSGPGRSVRDQLRAAIADGLKEGAVARKPGWSGWELFRNHFAPANPGPKEAAAIAEGILNDEQGYRGEAMRALQAREREIEWRSSGDERAFHLSLRETASEPLRRLVDAILAYDAWGRLLTDAFTDCLALMTQTRKRTSPSALARQPNVRRAHDRVAESFEKAYRQLEPFETETLRFQQSFAELAEKCPVDEWVQRLLGHHERVQRGKPPYGKNAFFARFDDGSAVVRPGYLTHEGGRGDEQYVHQYRTWPLWTFARDLQMLGS